MAKRERLDIMLVERGVFESRTKAQAAIMAGLVLVDGKSAVKAGDMVGPDSVLTLKADPCPYVSRGGLKLKAALEAFSLATEGRVCLDVGASTGGFTDCLLQAGASRVYAIDVGTAQLDSRLKADPRVVSREQTHAKLLRPEWFSPRPTLAVMDVSFISSAQVLPFVIPCLAPPFEIVVLVKPQFEVGPKLAPKGVVRDQAVRLQAVEKIRAAAAEANLSEAGILESPMIGPKGNHEFLLLLKSKP
ncbi:MAG: TlyA family rRNA (cytidine-2'-O)-methyltransferase [Elusimicrobia bacterium CG11_big_fil_rev_8_21_14_0_20_64_6]|nr:MAG: TlyA family rRNA (cytidine-2'-O)-methyltransferase [Elusimicrobia bacterium CG11_big_fil_rev_8_21_14_0_20_64_6]